jgi:hypothetical protein
VSSNKNKIQTNLMRKNIITYCFLLLFSCSLYSQEKEKECFNIEEISEFHSIPSAVGSLPKSNRNDILFKVDPNRRGEVLKRRLLQKLDYQRDSISPQIIENIDRHIKNFRIAFLANYTDSIIFIPTVYGKLSIIQEAQNENSDWKPIEYINNYVWCGTGAFHEIKLESQDYIEIYTRKYCGEFRTKLRLKLAVRGSIIISEEYEGYINYSQFDLNVLLLNEDVNINHINFIDHNLSKQVNKLQSTDNKKRD